MTKRSREETLKEKMYANMGKFLIPLFIGLTGWVLTMTYNTSIDLAVTKENTMFTREKMSDLDQRVDKLEVKQGDVNININNLNMNVNMNKESIKSLNAKYDSIMNYYYGKKR